MITDMKELDGDSCHNQAALPEEDFVQISSSHMGSTSLAVAKETVLILKQLSLSSTEIQSTLRSMKVDSILDNINENSSTLLGLGEALQQQTISLNSNLCSIQKHLLTLIEEVNQLKKVSENQVMMQRLEWAFCNFEKISDELDWENNYEHGFYRRNSHQMMRKILLAFRRGEGIDITSEDKKFHKTICGRINDLIGQRPRLSISDEKRCTIFYS